MLFKVLFISGKDDQTQIYLVLEIIKHLFSKQEWYCVLQNGDMPGFLLKQMKSDNTEM